MRRGERPAGTKVIAGGELQACNFRRGGRVPHAHHAFTYWREATALPSALRGDSTTGETSVRKSLSPHPSVRAAVELGSAASTPRHSTARIRHASTGEWPPRSRLCPGRSSRVRPLPG